ncbi:MAG: hypothetical protein EOL91_13125 [Actinobacteria bacterium]|nr:hypothetical protein [Actinomycetota bacterium]
MQPTATLSPTPDTMTLAGAGADDMLRAAVEHIRVEGWESPWATWLFEQLQARCGAWAAKVDQRCNRRPGTLPPEDVLTACWHTITRFPDAILAAKAPWAYLWTAVRNELAVDITAESVLSTRQARRPSADRPDRLVRVGLETHHLDTHSPALSTTVPAPPSDGLTALIQVLAEDDPDQVRYWTDVVDRALDVMADARRSYEEYALRRDPYLRDQAGLTLDELSALAALLIGPRRGDRAAQSLLLALRRDPATPVDAVPRAARRVRLLQTKNHARITATSFAA